MQGIRYCSNCMNEVGDDSDVCPFCGAKEDGTEGNRRRLLTNTILDGKYVVGKVIGEGGFGITYLGLDLLLKQKVAIKEYFPADSATRDNTTGKAALTVISGMKEELYHKGMDRFVREAASLAKFNQIPGIVSVKDFFYENDTAYMVMEYVKGITLSQYLKEQGGRIEYTKALSMLQPVMDALQKVHAAGIVHRDISPDNIMITEEGMVKLIDFGAARFFSNEEANSLTVILKHGYSPMEQYRKDGEQGPWTDVYALAATLYRMITGIVPPEAPMRLVSGNKLEAVSKLVPGIPDAINRAVLHALTVDPAGRTRSMEEFSEELKGNRRGGKPGLYIAVGAVAACVLIAFIVLLIKMSGRKTPGNDGIELSDTEGQEIVAVKTEDAEESSMIPEMEQEPEKEEYIAYREYFYKNYELSAEQDGYIYFADVEHRGMDDMIVVWPVYGSDMYYDINVYSYTDGEVSGIYSVRSSSDKFLYLDNREAVDLGELCGNILLLSRDDEMYLCAACGYEAGDYRIFFLDHEGNEIPVETIPYSEERKYYNLAEEVLPSDLIYALRLNSTNTQLEYDTEAMGGIAMAYNHDHRRMFNEREYEKVKEYEKQTRVIAEREENGEQILTDIAFADFDGDGGTEIAEGFCINAVLSGDNDNGYVGDGIGNRYNIYIEKNQNQQLIESFWDVFDPMAMSVVQFGNALSLLTGRDGSEQANGFHRNLLSYDSKTNKYIPLCIYKNSRGVTGIRDDKNAPLVSVDIYGRVFIIAEGHAGRCWLDVPISFGENNFYIFFLNGEYREYDGMEIGDDELGHLKNVDEAIMNAEEDIRSFVESDYVYITKLDRQSVIYASNDMVYINYYINFDGEYILEDCNELYLASVFQIRDGSLVYESYEIGRRELTSGMNIRSYQLEFPY